MNKIIEFLIISILFHSIVCESGICSWYGTEAAGGLTANGETFNPWGMTAAHKTLPFGTRVRVKCGKKSVTVRINDRGPFHPGRILDVSQGAAQKLNMINKGVCKCSYKIQ